VTRELILSGKCRTNRGVGESSRITHHGPGLPTATVDVENAPSWGIDRAAWRAYTSITSELQGSRNASPAASPAKTQVSDLMSTILYRLARWGRGSEGRGLSPQVFRRQAARFAGRSSGPRTTAIRFLLLCSPRSNEIRTVRRDCSGLFLRGNVMREPSPVPRLLWHYPLWASSRITHDVSRNPHRSPATSQPP
jgi:hypothetical protein